VQAALAAGLSRLIANDAPTRLGDTEGLHQMRVATRRLRSDLRTFRPIIDRSWADGLSEELRWLGGLLGTVRDADVQLERLHAEDSDLLGELKPYVERLRQNQSHGRDALLEALRGERYVTLLDRLVDAERDPLVSDEARRPAGQVLPDLAKRAWKRLEPQAQALKPDDPDARYHAVRIRAKRLRYATEAIGPALGDRAPALERVAAAAASLQDLLGEMHDAFVTRADLEGLVPAAKAREYAFALGRLVERRSASIREGRRRYPRAWRRLAKRWRKA